ncbi:MULTISPECIES: LysR substrate-binding domain-containing protein [unclassified Microbacterium]|uniref:LysR family transcriptional regulator n=1 Tax=unclassified Microbacterium TaxID=2609290 RepID=UPI0012F98A57|nr:LysR family transcriptional regulator [Microbacterium sp. MAH-37]
MELRDIEIFLTLADELHFGRTAERLHISQARVSQAINAQEQAIGARLFTRSSRRVELTPIGAELRDDLRIGYRAILDGVAKARSAAVGICGELRLGVMGNDSAMFLEHIAEFRKRYPGADLVIHEIHFSDLLGPLRRGEIDALIAWRPVTGPDIVEGPTVFSTGRVLAVWAGHPLSQKDSVSLEDLGDEVFVDPGPLDGRWIDAMIPPRTPRGRPLRRRGPRATTFHELLTLIAERRCVCVAGSQAAYYAAMPGVAFVPVRDAAPLQWALVWSTAAEGPLVDASAEVCRDAAEGEFETIPTD